MLNSQKGMTFWELVIIIAFVSLLSAIIIPHFSTRGGTMQFTQCQSNCKNMGTALEMFAEDNNEKFPMELALLTPDYLRVIPTCASSGTNQGYILSYRVSAGRKEYTFYCLCLNHDKVGVSADYPRMTSIKGLIAKP